MVGSVLVGPHEELNSAGKMHPMWAPLPHLVPAFPCKYRMMGWLEAKASSYHIWSFPWAFLHQAAGMVCLEEAAEVVVAIRRLREWLPPHHRLQGTTSYRASC